MYLAQVSQDLKWGFAGLSAGSSPTPIASSGSQTLGSPHDQGLGFRAVDPTRFPSHVTALRPLLDFYQKHGEGFVLGFVANGVSIPPEERAPHARGEGDPQHLPRFHLSYLLPVTI